jgi:hypothetical protein
VLFGGSEQGWKDAGCSCSGEQDADVVEAGSIGMGEAMDTGMGWEWRDNL